ncbi:hypothetical protein LWI29_037563 [Acer saccharum]|uniref:Uncharacterized protein n=1 Tax=Acer saccharum TaxID=4024 RepID=A0AA39SZ10_ACESA|nr:hypothetical protein LWI29_037563 [Acer saccharum]
MLAAQVCQSQQVGRSEDSLIGVPVHSSRMRAVPVSSEGPSSILDVSAGAVVSISPAASMVEQGSKVSRDSVSSLVSFAQPIVSSVVSVDELDDRVDQYSLFVLALALQHADFVYFHDIVEYFHEMAELVEEAVYFQDVAEGVEEALEGAIDLSVSTYVPNFQ